MSADKVPSVREQNREMRARRLANARDAVFAPNVKRQIANGLHFTAMSGIAALTTNFLNAWMQDRGMTGRQFTISVAPNPNQQTHQNPLKRKVG